MSGHVCAKCERPTRPAHTSLELHPGTARRVGDICRPCYERGRRVGEIQVEQRPRAELLEDLEFMAETGESLDGAARRLGMTRAYLILALNRAGRRCAWERMSARDEVAA